MFSLGLLRPQSAARVPVMSIARNYRNKAKKANKADAATRKLHRQFILNKWVQMFEKSKTIAVLHCNNMPCQETEELRKDLRRQNIAMGAYPNKLVSSWLEETEYSNLALLFHSTNLVLSSGDDSLETLKLLNDKAKSNPRLALMGMLWQGRLLDQQDLDTLFSLPPLKDQQAQLLGLLQSPAARLTHSLGQNQQALFRALTTHSKPSSE
eukprot:Colp12_sorted_trinity150504_noHs@36079